MSTAVPAPPRPRIRTATVATTVAFVGAGFIFASWASRIPQVRDALQLNPSQLGLLLLCISAGSVLSMPTAGPLVTRLGSRAVCRIASTLVGVSAVGVAFTYHLGVVPIGIFLFLLGMGYGSWDIAMNVQGAVVERLLGRSVMSRFHAGFSVGTVVGALLGSVMVAWHVAVTWHLLIAALLVLLVVPATIGGFVSDAAVPEPTEPGASQAPDAGSDPPVRPLKAWLEPRTIMIGLVVLAFAFTEGVGNDWIAVAFIDDYDVAPWLGTLGFAVFLTCMTLGRWFGPPLLDRYGRVVTVRWLSGVAFVGLMIFAFSPWPVLGIIGVGLWGLGASLGFPVGMSAGADEPRMAAARVSVVATIGYCAFLAGPPVIGFLGQHVTVLKATLVVAGLLALAMIVATSLRPLGQDSSPER